MACCQKLIDGHNIVFRPSVSEEVVNNWIWMLLWLSHFIEVLNHSLCPLAWICRPTKIPFLILASVKCQNFIVRYLNAYLSWFILLTKSFIKPNLTRKGDKLILLWSKRAGVLDILASRLQYSPFKADISYVVQRPISTVPHAQKIAIPGIS